MDWLTQAKDLCNAQSESAYVLLVDLGYRVILGDRVPAHAIYWNGVR